MARAIPGVVLDSSSGSLWPEVVVSAATLDEPAEVPPGRVLCHNVALYVTTGMIDIRWKSGARFSDVPAVGTVGVMPAGESFTSNCQPHRTVNLQIDPGFAAAAIGDDPECRFDLAPVSDANDPFLVHSLQALMSLAEEQGSHPRTYGEHVAISVAVHLARRYATAAPRARVRAAAPLDPIKLREIDEFIESHLDKRLPLNSLAGRVGMSPFRFARLFKLATGLPPHRYVLRKRVERAKTMLRTTLLTVSEVAMLCGFASHSHFTDLFRRMVGMSPGRFRSTHRNR
jgi:AraC family transcriptional regulator